MSGTIGATISFLLTSQGAQKQSCAAANGFESSLLKNQNLDNHNHGSFVLPFTIGGFLYISLVGIIPEIVEETNKKLSLIQLLSVLCGTLFIYSLVQIEHIIPGYYVI